MEMKKMSVLNAEEAIRFFKTYGFKLDEESVREWVKEYNRSADIPWESRTIQEDDLYTYNHWCFVKGTAYEEGIDDSIKNARLLEEIAELKQKNSQLHKEIYILESKLDIAPL
jgi:alanyl-tRNA synthetase